MSNTVQTRLGRIHMHANKDSQRDRAAASRLREKKPLEVAVLDESQTVVARLLSEGMTKAKVAAVAATTVAFVTRVQRGEDVLSKSALVRLRAVAKRTCSECDDFEGVCLCKGGVTPALHVGVCRSKDAAARWRRGLVMVDDAPACDGFKETEDAQRVPTV